MDACFFRSIAQFKKPKRKCDLNLVYDQFLAKSWQYIAVHRKYVRRIRIWLAGYPAGQMAGKASG